MLGTAPNARYAQPVSTDPGLGPKSSRTDPGLGGKEPAAPTPAPPASEPSVQVAPPPRPEQVDSVEAVLDGFGKDRPDRARVKPLKETTPLPPEIRPSQKGISTSPDQRQTSRKRVLYILITLICVLAVILLALVGNPFAGPKPQPTVTNATVTAPTQTQLNVPPPPTPTLVPTSVDSLPVATTTSTSPLATAKSTSKPSAGPTLTTPLPVPTTSVTPATTTSAPPASSGIDPKNDVKRTM